jgi:hypothetical protein
MFLAEKSLICVSAKVLKAMLAVKNKVHPLFLMLKKSLNQDGSSV